ncbi:MAG: DUF3786 domain-containing protein [Lachnospiraceae bacterium]|nr:DUF3786 domain-containing protein [Lachnospiraceae bacterium]
MRESYITHRDGKPVDNYEMTCEKWRKIYLEMDQEELIKRFDLECDDQASYIVYYNEKYRVDRKNGMITLVNDPEKRISFNTLMSIYNLFYYSRPWAKVRGEFVPFRQVKRAAPFDPAFKRMVLDLLADTFSGHCELLEKACQALGGRPIRQGDVGYEIKAFDCVPVTVVFWDGDEEFKAQANILFDADITDFIHEETVCCIGADAVRRLSEEAGLGQVEHLLGGDIVIEG